MRQQLFVGYGSRQVERWELPTWRKLPAFFTSGTGCQAAARPDDESLIVSYGAVETQTRVWRMPDINNDPIVIRQSGEIHRPAFSLDSKYVAIADQAGPITIHDLHSREMITSLNRPQGEPPSITIAVYFHPDHNRLLSYHFIHPGESELRIWNWRAGQLVQTLTIPSAIQNPCISPRRITTDGTRLVIALGSGLGLSLSISRPLRVNLERLRMTKVKTGRASILIANGSSVYCLTTTSN